MDTNEYEKLLYYLPSKMRKAATRYSNDFIKDTSLKDYYFPVLQAIFYQDGISQKELANAISRDKSRVSVIVNELIEQGLIYDSAEGRSSSLHLTESGKQANAVGRMYSKIAVNEFFKTFSEEELSAMKDFMIKLDSRLDEIISGKAETQ